MKNIALILSYDGIKYHGWQTQTNAISIQQTLTNAINKLLKCDTYVSGVGRTDAGVHARKYVANFKAKTTIPMEKLPLALNTLLPDDITIWFATEVDESFDARFCCIKKEYAYYIYSSDINEPFLLNRAYRTTYKLDVEKMKKAASFFVGKHDFSAFRAVGTQTSSTIRNIYSCDVEELSNSNFSFGFRNQKMVKISVCGDGFLYNMVRIIAGTIMYVGNGKIEPCQILYILKSRNRSEAGPTLPPYGLYMNRLWYKELSDFCLDL